MRSRTIETAAFDEAGQLELVLFEHALESARSFHAGGVRSFMIDHESRGKARRQLGADTEINEAPLEAIAALAALDGARVHCRINGWGPASQREIDTAVEMGAARVYLPMVTGARQAEAFLRSLDGRAEAAIMVETDQAVAQIRDFSDLPIDAVFVGLNDLAISRRKTFIFSPLADGTIDRLRDALPAVALGFGGVTCVDGGDPLPFRLLFGEMAAAGVQFSFLRRSFHRDIAGRVVSDELTAIRRLWTQLHRRSVAEVERDRRQLCRMVHQLEAA